MDAAQEVVVLPGLKESLLSINKLSEEGYTTVFHPGNMGVTIHKKGAIAITTSEPPVLQGCKSNSVKLWTVSAETDEAINQEETHNVYSLPSTPQKITYLHAAAGYPVEDTLINAIKAENFVTWPGLMATTVRKHFPESDKTIKGHMKKQRQGVRSTKVKEEEPAEEAIPELGTQLNVPTTPPNAQTNQSTSVRKHTPKSKRMNGMYIQIHNVSETMHSNQNRTFSGNIQQRQSVHNGFSGSR